MVRWYFVFAIITIVLVALFAGIASIVISSPIATSIANIANTMVAACVTLAIVLQWQLPQPAPPPLPPQWVKRVATCFVILLLLGTGTDVFLGIRFHPDNSIAHVVEGKSTVNTDFISTRWDHGDKAGGSCSPHPETDSYDLVAWPQQRGSVKPQPGGVYACFLTSNFVIAGNIALQINMKMNDGEEAGVLFKDSGAGNHYLYSINITTGAYRLSKTVANKSTPMDTAQNSAINKGVNSTNTLALTMIDHTICLYANQGLLHCIPAPEPSETGTIGLFVGTYPGNVTFSALKVWEL
jgi:hypothetical protein